MFKAIGRFLARNRYVRSTILEFADLSEFRKRPTPRLVVGVSLITISSLLGWPAVAVAGCVAVERQNALIFFLGGAAVYAFSWVLWGIGMLIAGHDSVRYARLLVRWMVRKSVERLLGGRERALAYVSPTPQGASSDRDKPGGDDDHLHGTGEP